MTDGYPFDPSLEEMRAMGTAVLDELIAWIGGLEDAPAEAGGHTQIARLLRHGQSEHRKATVRAVVFIGDAVEENPDILCDLAGQCGILQLPLFLFQEGRERQVETTFRTMAKLSGGAYARFDINSAATLAGLLGAVGQLCQRWTDGS